MMIPLLFQFKNISGRSRIGLDSAMFSLAESGIRLESSRGIVAFRILVVAPGAIELTPNDPVDELLLHTYVDAGDQQLESIGGSLSLPPDAGLTICIEGGKPAYFDSASSSWQLSI
jgi:hypothetical protein